MSYIAQLNHQLHPQPSAAYRVLDLFAGCGGLSLGFEAAGFHSVGYEMDERAADTYNKNLKGPCHAQKLSIETEYDNGFDVVIGGPPCQPFSVGGHQKGVSDERNGFPIFIKAVEQLQPRVYVRECTRHVVRQ